MVETGKLKEVAQNEERSLEPAGAQLPVVGQEDKQEL